MQEDEIRRMVRKAVHRSFAPKGAVESSAPVTQRHTLTGRKLITESDLQGAAAGSELVVPAGALLTPLARDIIRERNLTLVREVNAAVPAVQASSVAVPPGGASPEKTVALGADHGGFALKEDLKAYLPELGYAVLDCGTNSAEPVDYPDYAFAVAGLVSAGRVFRGIMVDGAGIGSCMAANKIPGIRAAMCHDLSTAVNSREHNDANVLTLGGGLLGASLARQIVKIWLSTDFGGGRHARRVDKIMAIEKRYLKK